jgi:hypothetical protein
LRWAIFAHRETTFQVSTTRGTLPKENGRLKKLVAEQALDMEILKEAAKGNW